MDATDKSYTNYLLEAKYPLSKATFVYATYLNRDDANATQASFGMRHNF
jgi:predicted porin